MELVAENIERPSISRGWDRRVAIGGLGRFAFGRNSRANVVLPASSGPATSMHRGCSRLFFAFVEDEETA